MSTAERIRTHQISASIPQEIPEAIKKISGKYFFQATITHPKGITETWYFCFRSEKEKRFESTSGMVLIKQTWIDGDNVPEEIVRLVPEFSNAQLITPWVGFEGEPQTYIVTRECQPRSSGVKPAVVVHVKEPWWNSLKNWVSQQISMASNTSITEEQIEMRAIQIQE